MHCLHKILVYIPDVVWNETLERDELIDNIRSFAESETERFSDKVFDYRSENYSAGGWNDEYPTNVLFAADDVDRFVEELEEVTRDQRQELSILLSSIEKNVGTDLNEIVKRLFTDEPDDLSTVGYCLKCVSGLLYGEYSFDSGFYNTHDYTSRIYSRDIELIRESPESWALVMLDYHI